MTTADSPMANMKGSDELLSSAISAVPLSCIQGNPLDSYHIFNTSEGDGKLISCNVNGHTKSMSNNVDKQQFEMPSREAGQTEVMQLSSGQMNISIPSKRKATTELSPVALGAQKICTPTRRFSPASSFSRAHSATSALAPNSSRSTASGRKVMPVESVLDKSQSTIPKKNAASQGSPKTQTGSNDSMRAKMRESLASALSLYHKQQEGYSDGKRVMESEGVAVSQNGLGECKPLVSGLSNGTGIMNPGNDEEPCSSGIPSPYGGSNNVGKGSQENEMSEEGSQAWNSIGMGLQPKPVLSDVDAPCGNAHAFKDELLQGNGLSWVSDLNPHIPELEQIEHIDKPELMHNALSSHEKDEAIQLPEMVASEIESELFKLFGGVNKKYKEKGRSLLFNLKDRNNPDLREKVMTGVISPDRLCSMTAEELASKELSQWRIAKAEELDQMKVLPDSDVNMRRLVKKTHKGEYQVDLDPDIGVPEEIPFGTSVSLQNRSKTNGAASPPSRSGKTVANEFSEITIPSDGADLMVDVRDLPPVISLDEFMESLDDEPPFEKQPVDCGNSNVSDEEASKLRSNSRSPVQSSKHLLDVTSQKTEEVVMENSNGVKSANSKTELNTHSVRLPKGERVWEGEIQLNISSMANVIALYKSGKKPNTNEWPGYFEIKGRVKLDAFKTFVQALRMSQSRAIMVSHFVLKEGSRDSELTNFMEVVDSYIVDQRLGFAEPAPGVEIYLCPPRASTIDVIIDHFPKSYTDKLNDIDNGLIGIVVWRKMQLTRSANSPNTSSHYKDITKKQPFAAGTPNTQNYDNRNVSFANESAPLPPESEPDGGDDVPPGFGPRDDDDLPEFSFSGSSNPPITRHSDPLSFSGQGVGSHHPHSRVPSGQVDQMRELIKKYGQNETNLTNEIPIHPWNDDEDDDIPEWQPQASHHELPSPFLPPAVNPVVPQHMVNPPWLPLQTPMSILQQGTWLPYGPNSESQPSGRSFVTSGSATGYSSTDWRFNASNYKRY